MAVIGGAYSSTAVTASLSQRLGRGEPGPFAAGIILASAVMYVRVGVLVAWTRARATPAEASDVPGNPIELLPAFGFVAIVALAAVLTRWAQMRYGESGIATSLFVTGMLDVDAAIVTLSGLPQDAIDRWIAAVALSGTIIANMAVKILVIGLYARRKGLQAMLGLGASTAMLVAAVGWRLILE
jgi:uncharacterized membrane protein (DUF4010 family)